MGAAAGWEVHTQWGTRYVVSPEETRMHRNYLAVVGAGVLLVPFQRFEPNDSPRIGREYGNSTSRGDLLEQVGTALAAQAPKPARPEVPESLTAPAGEELILVAHAKGTQIYTCQAGADQKFSWVLKAPEADLMDATGKKIGHHFAGPTWKHEDGSEVKAKVVAKQDGPRVEAPKPQAIPWLLLSATNHGGEGVFSRVTSIQRVHTEGGMPPQANSCAASTSGEESKSAYSADYYFYEAGPK